MKLTQENIKQDDMGTYKRQEITFVAPDGTLMTHDQIRKVCMQLEAKLPEGSNMTVSANNIIGSTTLFSTFNKQRKWLTDEEYDEYLGTYSVDNADKFNAFFNFTVTVRIPK